MIETYESFKYLFISMIFYVLSLFHLFHALDDCDCLKKCRVSKFMKLKYWCIIYFLKIVTGHLHLSSMTDKLMNIISNSN